MLVITPYFNAQRYESLRRNHEIFALRLKSQGIDLITVELTFGEAEPELTDSDLGVIWHVKSNSIMWQKEALINWVVNKLPTNETKFAWVDADVLFKDGSWLKRAEEKLDEVDVVQLFKRVYNLTKGQSEYGGERTTMIHGVIWQYKTYRNWLARRVSKELPFSHPGFAWAARRDAFPDGLYPYSITGSGDTLMVDSMLGSWDIHGYARKFTPALRNSIDNWRSKLRNLKVGFLEESIYHLWHGDLKNRAYTNRHNILAEHDFNPDEDVVLKDGILEWSSDKVELHEVVKAYFEARKEDV